MVEIQSLTSQAAQTTRLQKLNLNSIANIATTLRITMYSTIFSQSEAEFRKGLNLYKTNYRYG